MFKKRLGEAVDGAALKMFRTSSKSYVELDDGTREHVSDEFIRGAFCALMVVSGALDGRWKGEEVFERVLVSSADARDMWDTRFERAGVADD